MSKAFTKTCRQFLDELADEIEALENAPKDDELQRTRLATNCMQRAWHALDWIYGGITPAERARIEGGEGISLKTKKAFQIDMRRLCNDLDLCHQIAIASKHRGFDSQYAKYDKPHISVTVSENYVFMPSMIPDSGTKWTEFEHKVIDGSARLRVIDVCRRAHDFLQRFVNQWGIEK